MWRTVIDEILEAMIDGKWHTLTSIFLRIPEKPMKRQKVEQIVEFLRVFGFVDKRPSFEGSETFEYKLVPSVVEFLKEIKELEK